MFVAQSELSALVESIIKTAPHLDMKSLLERLERWMHFGLKQENARFIRSSLEKVFPHCYLSRTNQISGNDSHEPAVWASLLAAYLDAKAWDCSELCAKDAIWCELNLIETPVYLIDVVLQMNTENVQREFLVAVVSRIFSLPPASFSEAMNAVRLFMFHKWLDKEAPHIVKPTIKAIIQTYINTETFLKWMGQQGIFQKLGESSEESITNFFEAFDLVELASFLAPHHDSIIGADVSLKPRPKKRRLVERSFNGFPDQLDYSIKFSTKSEYSPVASLSPNAKKSEFNQSSMNPKLLNRITTDGTNSVVQPEDVIKFHSDQSGQSCSENGHIIEPLEIVPDNLKLLNSLHANMNYNSQNAHGSFRQSDGSQDLIPAANIDLTVMTTTENSLAPLTGTPLLRRGSPPVSQTCRFATRKRRHSNELQDMSDSYLETDSCLQTPKTRKSAKRRASDSASKVQMGKGRYFLRERTSVT
ncbi:unnamed protein product [Dicrocoelium dendriticum]|nr:unnamed protein product [Dicrocoelium dendriticum]